ncbi:unnamed protein product [Onchocerca flexuosa]|uniref:DUF3719 domain-containing protein n=1 Tax=Onchocerca flexuosa TaxID=387005 RepID=A0A183HUU6_9BILA|nr:unnamed protein product [Onchocerca flexuosa]
MSSMNRRPSRIPISCRNELKQGKNQSCRKSIILQNNPISDGPETKEHFLIRAERSIYEGEPMSDDEVEVECRTWARTLPHLRICGKSINKNYSNKMKSMNEDIIDRLIQDFLWSPVSYY